MKSQTNLKEELHTAWGSNAKKNLHTIEIVRSFLNENGTSP
jgi:hypothetical protein